MKRKIMSVDVYTKLMLLLTIISLFIYLKNIAEMRWTIVSGIFFGIEILASILLGWLETVFNKRSRTVFNLVVITTYPILFYDAMYYFVKTPEIRSISIKVLAVLVLLDVGYAWTMNKKTKSETFFKQYLIQGFCLFAGVLFLSVSAYGRKMFHEQTVVYSSEKEQVTNGAADENALANNIQIISKFDAKAGWDKWKKDKEKVAEIIDALVRVECRYLGMTDSYPKIEIAYLEEGLLGKYNSEHDTITISYTHLLDAESGYKIIETICHELRHRYQHYQVEMVNALKNSKEMKKYKDLLMLNDISRYAYEMDNYISGNENATLYSNQEMEKDAYFYGTRTAQIYYQEIEAYLQEQSE